MGNGTIEQSSIISGMGRSEVGRRIERDELSLTVDACVAAVRDAGLGLTDIDGLVTWPGEGRGSFGGPGVATMQDVLRLDLEWYATGVEGFNVLGSVVDAAMAVHSGLARHVLVYRTLTEATGWHRRGFSGPTGTPGGRGPTGLRQWQEPYGAMSAATLAALHAQRHFAEFGTTERQLGAIAVTARVNAAANPAAIYTDPMSMQDYLSSRIVTTPLRLFDCDVPADGSYAFVVSKAEHADALPHPPVKFAAMAASRHGRGGWEQRLDMTTMAAHDAGRRLWERTDLTPSDIGSAQLYDGFSIFPLLWLEALGFCQRGESGPFVEGGDRIARDGELPVNTCGGQLSGGRFVGFGMLYEACLQLRGEAGPRQLPHLRTSVVGAGGGNVAQAFILSQD